MGGQNGNPRRLQARQTYWALVLLCLAAFVLRAGGLAGLEFWFDEAISANVSALGWQGTLEYLRREPFEHPPLFYLSLYPWQRLAGSGEFALRFYSVFWGVLIVPLLYRFVKRLGGAPLGVLSALLAVVSPFMVAYSQETRMYTLLPFLGLLVLLCFLNALQRRQAAGWWLAYGLLVAVGVATHYYFALIWVATTIYLLLEWPRHRRDWLWGMAVQLLFVLVAVIWLVALPGPRGSLIRILQGETAFSLAYKLGKVMPSLMLSEIRGKEQPVAAVLLAALGWLLTAVGAWTSRRGGVLSRSGWRLLMLLLVVPLCCALLIPYGVLGRHLGYVLAAVLPFMALALVALQRKGALWLAAGISIVLAISTVGLVAQRTISKGDFGQAVAYIDQEARPGDLLILTQPAQRHLVDYYNREEWPILYLPPLDSPLTPALIESELAGLIQSDTRFWLGPIGAWTADPKSLVERWLADHAYQAQKAWFPQSSSAALYFGAAQPLQAVAVPRISWGGRIALEAWQSSPLHVAAGDALRLRFDWRPEAPIDERYTVNLALVDGEGRSWALRRSEPCSGWCPTPGWQAAEPQPDRHALLVPEGTPPGVYDLCLAWTPLDEGPALAAEVEGQPVAAVTLAQVTVVRPEVAAAGLPSLPNPLCATFGGEITLLGYRPAEVELQPGSTFVLETFWRAEQQPALADSLLAELVDARGRVCAHWLVPPSAAFYPTRQWQPGEFLRGQQGLTIPGDLEGGRYRLRVAMVDAAGSLLAIEGECSGTGPAQAREGTLPIASVRVVERKRRFRLPGGIQELAATVGQKADLAGYTLDLSQARPGGRLSVTLYWQAGGPLDRSYKVFTHLIGPDGQILAQHDGWPGNGCCPANTWREGEVVADPHILPLGPDLAPGTYRLVVGMYDEESGLRLPAVDGQDDRYPDDRVPVAWVPVASGPAAADTSPLPAPSPLAGAPAAPGTPPAGARPPLAPPPTTSFPAPIEGDVFIFLPLLYHGAR